MNKEDQNVERIVALEEKDDQIITRLIRLEENVERCATKDDVRALEGGMLHQFDQQMVILMRLDQERIFTIERIKRIEDDVQLVKKTLHIA